MDNDEDDTRQIDPFLDLHEGPESGASRAMFWSALAAVTAVALIVISGLID